MKLSFLNYSTNYRNNETSSVYKLQLIYTKEIKNFGLTVPYETKITRKFTATGDLQQLYRPSSPKCNEYFNFYYQTSKCTNQKIEIN